MSDDESSAESPFHELGFRLGLVVEVIGQDKSVQISGKSARQLKRYSYGAEPPFSVLKSLSEASGATLEWMAYGDPISETDVRLDIEVSKRTLAALKTVQTVAGSIADLERIKEEMALHRKKIEISTKQLALMSQIAEKGLIRPRLNAVSGAPALPAQLNPTVIEQLARVVTSVYRDAGHKVAPEKVAVEVANLYNELSSKVADIQDEDEIEATLPILRFGLKKRLDSAVHQPGTGKRSAS